MTPGILTFAYFVLLINALAALETEFFEEDDSMDVLSNLARSSRAIGFTSPTKNSIDLVCPAILFGRPSSCKPSVQCSPWFIEILRGPSVVCAGESFSMCCPNVFFNRGLSTKRANVQENLPVGISEDGRVAFTKMNEAEKLIVATSAKSFKPPFVGNKSSHELSLARGTQLAVAVIDATRALKSRMNLSAIQAGIGLQRFDVRETALKEACPAVPLCSFQNKYRTMDGACNNRKRPNWGRAGTPVERILPPRYADGIYSPKRAKNGGELPNARLVRTRVLIDEDHPFSDATHMAMQWGQFLDHDLAHIPMFKSATDTVIQCCGSKGEMLPANKKSRECFEIEVPSNDPFFGPMGIRCLNMLRSIVAPRADCRFGYADQMNTITHFIDASHIYGNDDEASRKLRELKGGLLRVQIFNGRPFTPEDPEGTNCIRDANTKGCFISGDDRMNQVPGLTALHVIFLREHNRIVGELAKINPRWGDEKLFQEGRRIVGAIMQRITYNEYLPVILGSRVVEAYGLYPISTGYAHTYNEDINPSITNEFTTAAFRMGHSQIQGTWHSVDESGNWQAHKLRDWFNRPSFLKSPDQMDSVLRGLAEQRCQSADGAVSEEVANHLFQRPGKNHGFDLISINIRRGRDHALDGYNAYRQVCGLPRARRFEDFADVMNREAIARIRSVYVDVDDVDLYVGGLSERPVPGGMIGATFTCLIADQFARLKEGDRFFYENGGQITSFTPPQLDEIRKASLARLICDNADNIKIIQPLVFRIPGKFNPRLVCSSDGIPRMDLDPWRE